MPFQKSAYYNKNPDQKGRANLQDSFIRSGGGETPRETSHSAGELTNPYGHLDTLFCSRPDMLNLITDDPNRLAILE